MYRNPLVYCTCWDPWGLGPRQLIETPQPPRKASWRRSKESIYPGRQEERPKSPQEVIDVSPGYQLVRSREQISVTLGDEMFSRKKQLEPEGADGVSVPRASVIRDLEEQISELTTIIEQMNRDHHAARKLLCNEMEQRRDVMKRNFEDKARELRMAHKAELSELENYYRDALKAEKSAAQGKLEEMQKEYKYLKNMFHMYQELLKQHEKDTVQLREMRKTKEIIEEELHAQALILESLNTNLHHTQMELQKEKAAAGNLEKILQNKLAEVEEKYKSTIQNLTEENNRLRQKVTAQNEEIYERQPEKFTSITLCECDLGLLEDSSKQRES
ncbi:amyotrophic lateral sclerosis 2 chromosomal region candidate gene 12 protein isoform X2 [Octodon degus]|uniref:Amyotrophic lateral sclerosis 2 chromosomal region candidate gene 12 protein isoform X2 n=1 Tax=Octodon degus TaxID=10160 RepID=A0A6P6E728_OCTDE|nr:amyotrophic lateral sclerosis 2 chromosomal region candidate gene 12 protein isoform X2 [Octodon degus]